MQIRKTVSDKTVAANRENAKKSTGPTTDIAKSNLKYHALKHGLLTKALLLRNEKEEGGIPRTCGRIGSGSATSWDHVSNVGGGNCSYLVEDKDGPGFTHERYPLSSKNLGGGFQDV